MCLFVSEEKVLKERFITDPEKSLRLGDAACCGTSLRPTAHSNSGVLGFPFGVLMAQQQETKQRSDQTTPHRSSVTSRQKSSPARPRHASEELMVFGGVLSCPSPKRKSSVNKPRHNNDELIVFGGVSASPKSGHSAKNGQAASTPPSMQQLSLWQYLTQRSSSSSPTSAIPAQGFSPKALKVQTEPATPSTTVQQGSASTLVQQGSDTATNCSRPSTRSNSSVTPSSSPRRLSRATTPQSSRPDTPQAAAPLQKRSQSCHMPSKPTTTTPLQSAVSSITRRTTSTSPTEELMVLGGSSSSQVLEVHRKSQNLPQAGLSQPNTPQATSPPQKRSESWHTLSKPTATTPLQSAVSTTTRRSMSTSSPTEELRVFGGGGSRSQALEVHRKSQTSPRAGLSQQASPRCDRSQPTSPKSVRSMSDWFPSFRSNTGLNLTGLGLSRSNTGLNLTGLDLDRCEAEESLDDSIRNFGIEATWDSTFGPLETEHQSLADIHVF
eukprot:g81549.t1